jgi:hypothetical protein
MACSLVREHRSSMGLRERLAGSKPWKCQVLFSSRKQECHMEYASPWCGVHIHPKCLSVLGACCSSVS